MFIYLYVFGRKKRATLKTMIVATRKKTYFIGKQVTLEFHVLTLVPVWVSDVDVILFLQFSAFLPSFISFLLAIPQLLFSLLCYFIPHHYFFSSDVSILLSIHPHSSEASVREHQRLWSGRPRPVVSHQMGWGRE